MFLFLFFIITPLHHFFFSLMIFFFNGFFFLSLVGLFKKTGMLFVFCFPFFLFKHIIPWSGLDIGYRLAWVPGIFYFLLFILKRNTIRTFFCLSFYTHSS